MLRQARADRRHRLLFGPRVHGRLRDCGRVSRAARADPRARTPNAASVELAKQHAHALFRLRQTRFTSFRSVFKPVEEIDDPSEATIELSLRDADELARAEDLRLLGEWAARSRELDYLTL